MTRGLIIGKFWPFHEGHEYLISSAFAIADSVDILVSDVECESYTLNTRVVDIYSFVTDTLGLSNSQLRIKASIDTSPKTEFDAREVAISEAFWQYWLDEIEGAFAHDYDYVFSSDAYGEELAKRLNAKWIPVDPQREAYQISGTEIRHQVFRQFDHLSGYAKPRFTKRIAIVGPESSGKSTLTHTLTYYLKTYGINCIAIPEFGRTLSEAVKHDMTEEDFEIIAKMQWHQVTDAQTSGKVPIIVSDTEAFTTYQFLDIYDVGDEHFRSSFYRQYVEYDEYDHYFLLPPDLDWTDDGERKVESLQIRKQMFHEMEQHLKQNNRPYTRLDEIDLGTRCAAILDWVEQQEKGFFQ